jgi:CheY-like chemotaxis protein
MVEVATVNRRIILLAETDLSVRYWLAEILTDSGFEVIVANDGSEALSKASEHKGQLDLFLADIEMPRLDGITTAILIKHHWPQVRVLLMSGRMVDVRLMPGVSGLIRKPFEPVKLITAIGEVLGRS